MPTAAGAWVLTGGAWKRKGRADRIPGGTIDRATLVYGTYKPGPTTTGVLPGSTLTTITNVDNGVSNTLIENKTIDAVIKPTAGVSNKVFRNCLIRGTAAVPTGTSGLASMFNAHGGGHQFIDCTFDPQTPHSYWVGAQGWGFTLERCNIQNLVDGVNVFNGNTGAQNNPCQVSVLGCWIHDHAWWPAGTVDEPFDGSHNDGIQWEGGSGLIVRGSFLDAHVRPSQTPTYYGTNHANAAMMLKPDVGLISGLVADRNWIDGGAYSVNIAHDGPARFITDIGSFTGNRFGRDQRIQGPGGDQTYTIVMPSDVASVTTGNVYDDTGNPILVRHNG